MVCYLRIRAEYAINLTDGSAWPFVDSRASISLVGNQISMARRGFTVSWVDAPFGVVVAIIRLAHKLFCLLAWLSYHRAVESLLLFRESHVYF